MENKKPTSGNGKICYVEIPATDIETSANFYHAVFGWKLRKRSEGDISFDDGVGEVSGIWVLNRPPMTEAGLVISIMVDDAPGTMESVKAYGGKVIYSTTMDTGEVIAHFTDPAGNVMGIYQESFRSHEKLKRSFNKVIRLSVMNVNPVAQSVRDSPLVEVSKPKLFP